VAAEQDLWTANQTNGDDESLPSSQASDTPVAEQPSSPTLELDSVFVDLEQVEPGDTFEVVVDFRVSDPEDAEDVTLIMDHSISQAGKILKQFRTKEYTVPNQDFYAITRQPKAVRTPGEYSLEVTLTYQDPKATGQATFTIQ
jgi:hypothetical protein